MNVTRNLQVVSRTCAAVALLSLLFAVSASAQAQPQPPKPGAELKPYDMFVGEWKYESVAKETPLGPAGKSAGTQTVRWILNGFVLEFKWHEKGPLGDVGAVEFDWYDAATKSYPYQGFMDNGDIYTATGTVSGKVWSNSGTQTHNGIQYKFRGRVTIAADGLSATWKNEMSPDGKKWIPWTEGRLTKVTKP